MGRRRTRPVQPVDEVFARQRHRAERRILPHARTIHTNTHKHTQTHKHTHTHTRTRTHTHTHAHTHTHTHPPTHPHAHTRTHTHTHTQKHTQTQSDAEVSDAESCSAGSSGLAIDHANGRILKQTPAQRDGCAVRQDRCTALGRRQRGTESAEKEAALGKTIAAILATRPRIIRI